jgi:tetratricopeptide (TPR) repeat protein
MTPRQVRSALRGLASQCGRGVEFLEFWRKRAAEALLGLAADLLRQAEAVRLCPRPRSLPDPRNRLRRLSRIRAAVATQPLPPDLRVALSPTRLRLANSAAAAIDLLEQAADLDPFQPALPLWRFEAAVLAGELRDAAQALRRASRQLRADRVAIALARARLLEARGRVVAAAQLLRRVSRRWPRDVRPMQALAALVHGEPQRAPEVGCALAAGDPFTGS